MDTDLWLIAALGVSTFMGTIGAMTRSPVVAALNFALVAIDFALLLVRHAR